MSTVRDFCSPNIALAFPSEPLLDVAARMHAFEVESVVLVEQGSDGRWGPCGILRHQDIVAQALRPWGPEFARLPAGDVARSPLEIALENDDLLQAVARMRQARLTCVPVVTDDGAICGVLRLEDLFDYFSMLSRALEFLVTKPPRAQVPAPS